jgi:hypothetical protein
LLALFVELAVMVMRLYQQLVEVVVAIDRCPFISMYDDKNYRKKDKTLSEYKCITGYINI